MPLASLQYVIVVFPEYTHLLLERTVRYCSHINISNYELKGALSTLFVYAMGRLAAL